MKRAARPQAEHRPSTALCSLARALVRAGHLTERTAQALQQHTRTAGQSFISAFLERGTMTAPQLAQFICASFGYPLLELTALNRTTLPEDALRIARQHGHEVLPLAKHGRRLTLAMADPVDGALLEALRTETGLTLDPVVAALDALRAFESA